MAGRIRKKRLSKKYRYFYPGLFTIILARVKLGSMKELQAYSAFAGFNHLATGSLETVVTAVKERWEEEPHNPILIFENKTGRQVDFDMRGSTEEVLDRIRSAKESRGRGRPRLGVECNELCLLPRHWEWLAAQQRSASATIRRLIDAARKSEAPEDRRRERQDAIGAFMWAIAGDLPRFEEASRRLYRSDWDGFREQIADWPEDLRDHLELLLKGTRDS